MSNTRIFNRSLKEWVNGQNTTGKDLMKIWVCNSCIAYGKSMLSGLTEEALLSDLEKSTKIFHYFFIFFFHDSLKQFWDKFFQFKGIIIV